MLEALMLEALMLEALIFFATFSIFSRIGFIAEPYLDFY